MHPHAFHPAYAEPIRRSCTARGLVLAILVTAFVPLLIACAIYVSTAREPEVQIVQRGEVIAMPLPDLPAQRVADLRLEGFRAGLAQGIEQGCAPAHGLSYPLGIK